MDIIIVPNLADEISTLLKVIYERNFRQEDRTIHSVCCMFVQGSTTETG